MRLNKIQQSLYEVRRLRGFLKEIRKESGKSVKDFAKVLWLPSITIYKVEKGERLPSIRVMSNYISVLSLDVKLYTHYWSEAYKALLQLDIKGISGGKK